MKNDSRDGHKIHGLVIILLVILILLVALANLQLVRLKDSLAQTRDGKGDLGGGIKAALGDNAVMGNPEAKVTIVEFSDYECPFCGKFYRETFPQIKKDYIDTGKARFVYRDFPLSNIHAFAEKAAQATECARNQGKYWEYADILFNHQDALAIADLKGYAGTLGLNRTAFDACLDSGTMAMNVQKDLNEGISYGVKGTPAFFVNDQFISGARPYGVFKDAIEKAISQG